MSLRRYFCGAELRWQFGDADAVAVASDHADPLLEIIGPHECGGSGGSTVVSASGTDLGYEPAQSRWGYDWTPALTQTGCFDIFVTSRLTGQRYGPFEIEVTLVAPP